MNTARSILEITGDDRVSFLQGLLTQDVTQLASARIQFAALLSPQGKILHDMFLVAYGDAILIDTPEIYAETLRKRLTMYKLRAKVNIRDVSAEWRISYVSADTVNALPDPRHVELPWRIYASTISMQTRDMLDFSLRVNDEYIFLGIPDSAGDFAPDEITAMDAGYDLLHAISFTKGCYVGQEIVARMHYKNIARKGFFIVTSDAPIISGASLMIGTKQAGVIRYADGKNALVFLKLEDGMSNAPATVDNSPVRLRAPGWMQPKIDSFAASQKTQP